jgi:hypothetical protein
VNTGQAGPNWVAANNYGISTKSSFVYQCSISIQSSGQYDFLATFHIGDFYSNWIPYGHWECEYTWDEYEQQWWEHWYFVQDGYEGHYCYYSSYNPGTIEGIHDYVLYSYTGWKHRFTFMYTCANGGLMDTNNDGNYDCYSYWGNAGVIGMPLAWTHRNDLSWNGYASPDHTGYCYIGFENISKWACDNGEFYYYNYADFVKSFYHYALGHHYSVSYSLDRAMLDMTGWEYNFGGSWLNGYWAYDPAHDFWAWSRMRVLGDGTMSLIN